MTINTSTVPRSPTRHGDGDPSAKWLSNQRRWSCDSQKSWNPCGACAHAGIQGDSSMNAQLLAGIRVLELAEGVAGPYAAKLLADLGADVVKVESPSGDIARTFGPFTRGVPHPGQSGLYIYLNAAKRRLCLDLSRDSDRAECLRLAD